MVVCWGSNGYGQTGAPAGRFSAVSAGERYTCALRETGAVVCWGRNNYGETNAPTGRFSALSAGGLHTCGLRETGAVECWGWNWAGQTDAPTGRFSALSAGGRHSCGLRETGAVECWGYTFDGQTQPPAGEQRAISAGPNHACAVSVDGAATCWMIYNGAADVPAWLREPSAAPTAESGSGRIVARRLADGRTELGWQPADGGERVLPQQRYFPTDATVGRWLRSSPIEANGVEIGRINARLLADGRIEFAFTPTGGERILPQVPLLPRQSGRRSLAAQHGD